MQKVFRFLLVNLGILLVAASIAIFKAPNHFAAGGVSGIAILVNRLLPSLTIGLVMLVTNVVLFIAGFAIAGLEFGVNTVYCTLALSAYTWIIGKVLPLEAPLTGDAMLELIFAILLSAAGSALLFYQNASSGGTDILAKILNKKLHWHIGQALLAVDLGIALLAIPVFGVRAGLYSVLGVIAKGFLIDEVIRGLHSSKRMFIVSDKAPEIREYIIDKLKRGVTVYTAVGGKTGEPKTVLNTVMDNRQALRLRQFIRSVDDSAFVIVDTVTEIYGKGFLPPDL